MRWLAVPLLPLCLLLWLAPVAAGGEEAARDDVQRDVDVAAERSAIGANDTPPSLSASGGARRCGEGSGRRGFGMHVSRLCQRG